MSARVEEAVFVEAPARLHFGVLDLRGTMGRWFGGIGAAAPAPTLLVSAVARRRAAGRRRGLRPRHGVRPAAAVARGGQPRRRAGRARARAPRAAGPLGLGSGTQLALAIARALADLHGFDADAPALARVMGRARRSAIGTWTFAGGGLVVEGGRRVGQDESAPLLARLPFPPSWRCVVAVPHARAGVSGAAETQAFAQLAPPPDGDVERVAYLVLMSLLPALVEADIESFGAALSEIQEMTGTLVRRRAGRHVRARPHRDAGAQHGAVGRARRGAELVGPGGLRHRGRRGAGRQPGRARARGAGPGRPRVRRAVPLRRRARVAGADSRTRVEQSTVYSLRSTACSCSTVFVAGPTALSLPMRLRVSTRS